MRTWNLFLFGIFPYIAFAFAIFGGIYRYRKDKFSYSSFSSQLLENRILFWGTIIFHYSIILILLAHLWGGWFPRWSSAWLSPPFNLFVVELSGYVLGYATAAGLAILVFRRLINPKLRKRTTLFDWIILVVLMFQILIGVHLAHAYRWGALWYVHTATPWFYSMLSLNPDYSTIIDLPWTVKAHAFTAYVIFFLFPFTRLVHIFTFPITYLWRPFQVVIWNRWKSARPWQKMLCRLYQKE